MSNTSSTATFSEDLRVRDSVLPMIISMSSVILSIVGVPGHSLIATAAIYNLKKKLSSSITMNILTVIQSVADILCLTGFTLNVVMGQGFGIHLPWVNTFLCKFNNAVFGTLFGLSANITVIIETARYLAADRPQIYDRLSSAAGVAAIFSLTIIINLFTFLNFAFMHKIVDSNKPTQRCKLQPNAFLRIDPFIYFIFIHLSLPPILTAAFTLLLFFCLRQSEGKGNVCTAAGQHITGLMAYKRSLNLLQNNILSMINAMDCLVLISLYFAVYEARGTLSPIKRQLLVDCGLSLTLLPKALSFLILFYTSEYFRKVFKKSMPKSLLAPVKWLPSASQLLGKVTAVTNTTFASFNSVTFMRLGVSKYRAPDTASTDDTETTEDAVYAEYTYTGTDWAKK